MSAATTCWLAGASSIGSHRPSALDLLSTVATAASIEASARASQKACPVQRPPDSPPSDAEGSHCSSTRTGLLPANWSSAASSSSSDGGSEPESDARTHSNWHLPRARRKRPRDAGLPEESPPGSGGISPRGPARPTVEPTKAGGGHPGRLPPSPAPLSPLPAAGATSVGAGWGRSTSTTSSDSSGSRQGSWIDLVAALAQPKLHSQPAPPQQQQQQQQQQQPAAGVVGPLPLPLSQQQQQLLQQLRPWLPAQELATGGGVAPATMTAHPWLTVAATAPASATAPTPAPASPVQQPVQPVQRPPLRDLYEQSITVAREGMCRGIALLAGRQRLDRGRVENFLRVLDVISQRHWRDCSAGMGAFLSELLRTQPSAFRPQATTQAAGLDDAGLARFGQREETAGGALLRRLTMDEGACMVVATPAVGMGGGGVQGAQGGESVVCSQRMATLFASSAEYAGALAQAGVATWCLWPQLVCHGPALEELFAATVSTLLDPFSRPQLDVVVQCRTRQGQVVKCLATTGSHLSPACIGSFTVLRLHPCGHRDIGPLPPPPAPAAAAAAAGGADVRV